jgi:hypothetical protein
MLWIPAFAGMTEETDGLDKSSPYIYIDQRACPRENGERLSYGFFLYLISANRVTSKQVN